MPHALKHFFRAACWTACAFFTLMWASHPGHHTAIGIDHEVNTALFRTWTSSRIAWTGDGTLWAGYDIIDQPLVLNRPDAPFDLGGRIYDRAVPSPIPQTRANRFRFWCLNDPRGLTVTPSTRVGYPLEETFCIGVPAALSALIFGIPLLRLTFRRWGVTRRKSTPHAPLSHLSP